MNILYIVNKPLDFVYDYLNDMQKFVTVHPVITRIDDLGESNYLVHETLKIGFLPISFTYRVFIKSDYDEKKIRMEAIVMKFSKVTMDFKLEEEEGVTKVNETIQFKTIFFMKSILEKVFKKQHRQLFSNIQSSND